MRDDDPSKASALRAGGGTSPSRTLPLLIIHVGPPPFQNSCIRPWIYHHKKVTALQIYNPDLQKTMGDVMDHLVTPTSLTGPNQPAHKTSTLSRRIHYYLPNAMSLRLERRTRPINLHGLHDKVVAIKIDPFVRKQAGAQSRHVPNNDFDRNKQGQNYTNDRSATYLYITNTQKLSTAATNLLKG